MEPERADAVKPPPGWYALLAGQSVDLDDWSRSLIVPFDPVAQKLPDGRTVLRSRDFEGLSDAKAVRARAVVLIARMNGALALWNGARPVQFGGVLRIEEDGREHLTVFGEVAAFGRSAMRAAAVVLGSDGNPLPHPPPQPSQPQVWNELAELEDDLSDLLEQFGRADNWYDIYKTIEIAAHVVGGKHRLWKALQPQEMACRNLDQNANFYRHARAPRPIEPISLRDAKPLLAWIVRRVLDTKQPAAR